jgi:hypothetical protein
MHGSPNIPETPDDTPSRDERSPWSAPGPLEPSVHWREQFPDRGANESPGDSIGLYYHAFAGVVAAAMIVPVLAVVVIIAGGPWRPSPNLRFLLFNALVAIPAAGIFAAAAAACVFPIVGLVQYLSGLHAWRVLFASIAGGWSGILLVQFMSRGRATESFGFQLIAMAVGQLGAGIAARSANRAQVSSYPPRENRRRRQLKLRQLLGLTAGVALISAILGVLQLSREVAITLGLSLTAQAILIAIYYGIRAVLPLVRRLPASRVDDRDNEAPDVPRETTAAVGAN